MNNSTTVSSEIKTVLVDATKVTLDETVQSVLSVFDDVRVNSNVTMDVYTIRVSDIVCLSICFLIIPIIYLIGHVCVRKTTKDVGSFLQFTGFIYSFTIFLYILSWSNVNLDVFMKNNG
ncbi:uncharacterized protein LOC111620199 [Centruroides sculpturatus]|uniref:uncharacterized protein LOC111620199 n=1 Tax=Centruroides sculpturatus TaxID=218467 RepID=UPI000C6D32C5|nr:uncharacterized protein LOC111620199 [Centruroides sculpturatus]